MKVPEPVVRLPYRRGSVEFCLGTEADHEAVYQTLLHVFQGPDRDAFLGALSDPSYKPEQRILVKVDGRVVSHVHLTERTIRYGSATMAMNGVMWVGTLPEYRGPRLRPEPDAAGRRPGPRDRRGAPGPHHRDAPVLPAAGLGRLRPAVPAARP